MTTQKRTIVVCGATGKQGGAVVDALLAHGGFRIVALSRDLNGPKATALRAKGVELHRADLEDRRSLAEAFRDAYGIYGVTTPMTPKGKLDIDKEREQGINVAEACADSGIAHLVMSTVLYISDDQLAIPYVRSKKDIESRVIERGIPHTFLWPASFMDELGGEYLPVKNGVITGQAANDAKVPYIACRDIGEFARLAFSEPERFIGQKLNLIGDFISGHELAAVLSRVAGRPFKHKAPPMWLMWIFARAWITLRKQFESWGRPPHPHAMLSALDECRRLRPDTITFEGYLRATGFGASS
jgi:uncharacterized protein YbjT (DUF2867 family)